VLGYLSGILPGECLLAGSYCAKRKLDEFGTLGRWLKGHRKQQYGQKTMKTDGNGQALRVLSAQSHL
jgi:hypothetical protein